MGRYERAGPGPGSAARLLECPAEVVVWEDRAGCGLARLHNTPTTATVLCLVLSSQCRDPSLLYTGARVIISARLVSGDSGVPYLAASVRGKGQQYWGEQDHTPDLLQDPEPGELDLYWRYHDQLLAALTVSAKRSRQDVMQLEDELVEVWGERGVSGEVVEWQGETGTVRARDQELRCHLAQVWVEESWGAAPGLETRTRAQLLALLQPRARVMCNAARVDTQLVGTAVWVGWPALTPPPPYRTPALLAEITARLHNTNPLAGAADTVQPATVTEHLSLELGLARLQSDDSVVLLHLGQLWQGEPGAGLQPAPPGPALHTALPLGSTVMLNWRPLPAHPGSRLTGQATILWRSDGPSAGEQQVPTEYIAHYKEREARAALVTKLDSIHETVKELLGLSRSLDSPEFLPVHVVLNGLPAGWDAKV